MFACAWKSTEGDLNGSCPWEGSWRTGGRQTWFHVSLGTLFFFKPCAYVICDRKRNITIPETEAPLYSFDSSSLSSFKLFGIALETHKPPSPYNIFPSVVITQNPVGIKEVFQRLLSLDRVHWCFIVTLILSFPFAVSRACVACLLLEEAAFW